MLSQQATHLSVQVQLVRGVAPLRPRKGGNMIAFFFGTMVGGFFGVTMMCLFQINRLHEKDDAFEKR